MNISKHVEAGDTWSLGCQLMQSNGRLSLAIILYSIYTAAVITFQFGKPLIHHKVALHISGTKNIYTWHFKVIICIFLLFLVIKVSTNVLKI